MNTKVANVTNHSEDRLSLRSHLSDITKLPVWIEGLEARYAVPANLKSVMNLCLEEALSNVIRHGYGNEAGRAVTVQFTAPRAGYFVFVIDDEAPRFNPLEAPELSTLDARGLVRVGGQGIRFLRRFTDTLEYEPTPSGNRLRMGFSATGPVVRTP